MDDFDKKIREIKIFRQPEAYLDDIFGKITKCLEEYNIISYKIGNQLIFKYYIEKKYFRYHYEIIYSVLVDKYNLDEFKINILIKNKVKEYLKLNNITVSLHPLPNV